jgi:ACS family tartrate transporter-like MFS transporter
MGVWVGVGLALVVFAKNTLGGFLWFLRSWLLRGAGAAAGIGLINSLGNLGGFVGPNLFGSVKNITGSYALAFFFLSALALIASIITLTLRRAKALAR